MAEISVIVPVYRVEPWLAQCVQSILAQSFRELELILVDDGSPDGCGALCDSYARQDRRVRVIHQENRGVSAARNAGLDLASGRFVTFCDGDDFWGQTHLQQLWDGAVETGADLVSCNYRVVSESGKILRETDVCAGSEEFPGEAERLDYLIRKVLGGKTGWAVWNRLFCRERLGDLRFCEDSGYGEDLAFTLDYLLSCGKITALPQATCYYRLRGGYATDGQDACTRLPGLVRAMGYLDRRWSTRESAARRQFPRVLFLAVRETLEDIPGEKLPEILEKLPEKDWFFRQMEAYLKLGAGKDKALARFCIHRRLWRYRLDRRFYGRH